MTATWKALLIAILSVFVWSLQLTGAQSVQVFSELPGTWQGEGKAFGMPARLELKWEWVLEKKFLRLKLRNEMTTPGGEKQVFEGHAYYRAVSEGKYEAQWFDSRGVTFPVKAQLDGNSMVAYWGSAEQEEGKSIYRLVDGKTLEVVDSVKQKDGTWREFGRATLTRTGNVVVLFDRGRFAIRALAISGAFPALVDLESSAISESRSQI